MKMDLHARPPNLVALDVFLGEWRVEASIPLIGPAPIEGRMLFEWTLDGQFLMQRSTVSHPDAPDSMAIIGPDGAADNYLQHYFDSRGIARVYAMNLSNGVWTLIRETADFSELKFSQRFIGTFSEDTHTITAAWETSQDGVKWDHDFDLAYRRVT
jgi:hypothetical protein